MNFLIRQLGQHPIISALLLCGGLVYFWPKGPSVPENLVWDDAGRTRPNIKIVSHKSPAAPDRVSTLALADEALAEVEVGPPASPARLQALMQQMQEMTSCYQGHPCFQSEVLTDQQRRSKVTHHILRLSKQIKQVVPALSTAQLESVESFLQQQFLTAEDILVFTALDILQSMPTDAQYVKYIFQALNSMTSELVCLSAMRTLKVYVEAGHVALVFDNLKNFLQNNRFDDDRALRVRLNVLIHMHVLIKKDTVTWFEDVRSLYDEDSNEYRILSNHLSRYE